MAGMAAVIADVPHGYAIGYFAERKPRWSCRRLRSPGRIHVYNSDEHWRMANP